MAINRKLISDVMSKNVFSVNVTKPAADALKLMQQQHVSSVLVVDDGMILGIITERDIVRAWSRDHEIARESCADLMQSPVVTVTARTRCLDAYHMMSSRGLRHLAVVDDTGQVVGMVSEGDVMRNYGLEYYMNFKDVASVMNTDFCRLAPSAPVSEALRQMIQYHQSCVVAVDGEGKPLGVLSERDAVRLCRLEARPDQMSVGAAMVSPVITVKPGKRLHTAVKFMESNRIRRLVVVDAASGAAVGLLTHHEVARGLEGDYVQYLKDIIELQSHASALERDKPIDERLVLANILRAVTGTAFLASDLDFRISFATPSAAELLGLRVQDIDGGDLRDALVRAGWADAHDSLPATGMGAGMRRVMVKTAGGPTAIQVTMMVDARNDPQGYLVLAQRG